MIHLAFLPAGGNRFSVFTQWAWSFLTHQQESRLILEVRPPQAPVPPDQKI